MKGMLVWGLAGKHKNLHVDQKKELHNRTADSLTSLDSLTPYEEETMDRFMKLLKNTQG